MNRIQGAKVDQVPVQEVQVGEAGEMIGDKPVSRNLLYLLKSYEVRAMREMGYNTPPFTESSVTPLEQLKEDLEGYLEVPLELN